MRSLHIQMMMFVLLFSAITHAQNREIAQPVQVPTRAIDYGGGNSNSARESHDGWLKALEFFKQFPPSKQTRDNDAAYSFDRATGEQSRMSDVSFPMGYMPFEQTAKECGETMQAQCTPDKMGGASMCGLAVRKMIDCMKGVTGASAGCTGQCGNGKDFVNCQNGQMEKCGYAKVTPATDIKCKMPGAVLAYSRTETDMGKIYGHVEFVCGRNKYCSMYSQPHDRPWPTEVADACWYPTESGGNLRGPR